MRDADALDLRMRVNGMIDTTQILRRLDRLNRLPVDLPR